MKKYKPMLNLKIMRIRKGMTQIELARKVGKASNMIYFYESGHAAPRTETLKKLADALGCEIKDIV
mgnify:FL=1